MIGKSLQLFPTQTVNVAVKSQESGAHAVMPPSDSCVLFPKKTKAVLQGVGSVKNEEMKAVRCPDANKASAFTAHAHSLPLCEQSGIDNDGGLDDCLLIDAKEEENAWRLGLAVTKKTGCAVERNRVKRVLREFFRLNQHLLPDAVDIVVVPKRHLKVRRVSLNYVTQELSPLLVAISQYTTHKLEK